MDAKQAIAAPIRLSKIKGKSLLETLPITFKQ